MKLIPMAYSPGSMKMSQFAGGVPNLDALSSHSTTIQVNPYSAP